MCTKWAMKTSPRGKTDWIGRIRRAIDEKRFCMDAQEVAPISLAANAEYHRELLLRMIDDHGALIQPMAFIPAAERYNLMPALDRLVVAKSFAYCAKVFASEVQTKKVRWSINLSGTSLNDETFFEFVRMQFQSLPIPYDAICFEITETAAITNFARAQQFINEFKQLGCRFSLDDFGSGMSSFAYLKHLPVDYLKIDGAFIEDILDDPIDRAMVEAINTVAHLMGVQTIAEFVENQEQLELLRKIGVDYAQGFGISRPQLFFSFSDNVGALAIAVPIGETIGSNVIR
jgi:EAL domain-containing protein (putative c-di-GMP-specific phosphodiesterase class I)